MGYKDIDKAERLYHKYSRLLYKVALRITDDAGLAEDAVQQTFEIVIRIASKIDEDNERATGGLLVLMCKQAVAEQYHAKTKSVGDQTLDDESFDVVSHEDVWQSLVHKNAEANFKASLKWLDEKYVEPLIYKYVHEYDVDEIAKIMNLNVHTVYTRLNRGRELIKRRMLKNGGELE